MPKIRKLITRTRNVFDISQHLHRGWRQVKQQSENGIIAIPLEHRSEVVLSPGEYVFRSTSTHCVVKMTLVSGESASAILKTEHDSPTDYIFHEDRYSVIHEYRKPNHQVQATIIGCETTKISISFLLCRECDEPH